MASLSRPLLLRGSATPVYSARHKTTSLSLVLSQVPSNSRSGKRSVTSKGIETLVGIADERQADCRIVSLSRCLSLGTHLSRIVDLWDLVDGKIGRVDIGLQLGLERSADLAQRVPIYTIEERMRFQFGSSAITSKAVLWVADEAAAGSAH